MRRMWIPKIGISRDKTALSLEYALSGIWN